MNKFTIRLRNTFLLILCFGGGDASGRVATTGYTPGNCSDPNVAAWLSFDDLVAHSLTVPAGCSASGTVFAINGHPTYGVPAPAGLGYGVQFNNGVTALDYFDAGNVSSLNFGTSDAVIEAWINPNATQNGSASIVSKYLNLDGWIADITSSLKPRIDVIGDSGAHECFAVSTTALAAGVYSQVRWTWNHGTATGNVYINGTLAATCSAPGFNTSITTATVEVAARGNGLNVSTFTGSIADLRVTIGNATNNLGFSQTRNTRTASQ